MTDKELIKEEIEKQKSFYQRTFDVLHPDDLDATIAYAHIELLDRLLQFIDSIPKEPTVKGITWEDVNTLDILINQVRHEFPNGIGEKSFGLAVIEKFQDCYDDIEEPASKDLEEENPIEGEFPYTNPSDTLQGEIENIFGKLSINGIFTSTKEGFSEVISHFVKWQHNKEQQ